MKKLIFLILIFCLVSLVPKVSASHFITGFVNNSYDGEDANDYLITLWNPAIGLSDNLTDIIGTNGNSGADNIYFLDCELLNTPCSIGDTINAKIFNNGSGFTTPTTSLIVTGAGFDVMPNSRLNSKPTVNLNFPANYANLSNSNVTLMCTSNDLDSNLANVTLYGNWSNGWHANQSSQISGSTNSTNFTNILQDGRYDWSCLATDNLSISQFASQNFSFTLDTTPPVISSVSLNITESVCGTQTNLRINCTVTDELIGLNSVLIESFRPSGRINHTTQLLSGNTYYLDILLNETGLWQFRCIANDTLGNSVSFSSENLSIHTTQADIKVSSSDIVFSNNNPIENSQVIINATIHNIGCTEANNFPVGFFEGDPEISAIQIGSNRTISIPSLSNFTTNITWQVKIGTTNAFVFADLNFSISESNETNNKANKTILVNAWQEFFGNVTIDKILSNQGLNNISIWYNESFLTGNIFITDSESTVSWNSLLAIGKNLTGSNTTDDFFEIDTILNMTNFTDSVSNVFTTNGIIPIESKSFFVYKQNLTQVPVVNSTNNTNFKTGILWDTSDDTNGQFDETDKEDLIFISQINNAAQGSYGIYDYEIRIPVRLREYYTSDINNVFVYFDLN
jgi:hypothetical protein